jgi:O-antigen/teichoic acid export membrane protein
MASQVLTAFVGFVFWLLAAHAFSQTDVGFASAVVSGMSLVGAIGVMGLGTLLIRDIPRHPGREMGMIAASLIASAVIGGLLGVGFVIGAPFLSSEFLPLRDITLLSAVAIGAGLTSASLVSDQAVIGLFRSRLQLGRNITAAVARLVLLVAFVLVGVRSGGLALIGAWVGSVAVSFLGLGAYSAWRRSLIRVYPLHWDFLGETRWSALEHHLLNLAIQVPGWVMPLIAVAALSARTNAGFYIAWLLVGLASFVPVALTWVLYAAASREPSSLGDSGWMTLRLSAVAAAASTIGLWALGPWTLEFFGRGYADVARSALLVLPLTLFPVIIKAHYITISRVRGTVVAAAGIVALGAGLEIVGAFIGANAGGLVGLGVGLLAAMVLESIVMLPTVYQVIIRRHLQPQPSQA